MGVDFGLADVAHGFEDGDAATFGESLPLPVRIGIALGVEVWWFGEVIRLGHQKGWRRGFRGWLSAAQPVPVLGFLARGHKAKSPVLGGLDGSGAPPPRTGDIAVVKIIIQFFSQRYGDLSSTVGDYLT